MLNSLKAYHYFFIHIGVLFILFFCLYFIGVIEIVPSNDTLIQWDAGWYKSIVDNGYVFQKDIQSNTGFFPFFPFIWKYIGLSNVGISILNYLMFLLGVFLVCQTIPNLKNRTILFSLSFPSLFFMYVPYSEALFFLTASLYLYGNYKSQIYLKVLALLLASFARPIIFFFLPAIIFSEFLGTGNTSSKTKAIIGYSLMIFIGTFVSFYIVGYSSNNLFAYSDSQINNWDHSFSIPSLPLTTWRGYRILWLDMLGLWIVISALLGSFVYFIKTISSKMKLTFDKNLLLSLSYLSMIFIYVLFFHPKEESSGLTSILSLNRYVFCSPFIFYLMYYYFTRKEININKVVLVALVISLVFVGFPLQGLVGLTYVKTIAFILLVVLFLIAQVSPKLIQYRLVSLLVYLTNTTLQVYLFQSFLKGNWIG